jgi:RNA recognition motif-containing protein
MSPEYDERQVTKLFEKYGPIKNVQLARNLRSAKRLDFAFVIYEHHKDAVACVKGIFL